MHKAVNKYIEQSEELAKESSAPKGKNKRGAGYYGPEKYQGPEKIPDSPTSAENIKNPDSTYTSDASESEDDALYHRLSRKHSERVEFDSSETKLAIQTAINQKALDVRGIHVGPQSSIADYFVIASGTSERHVKGIADKIDLRLREIGVKPLSVSGYENADWIVLDYGDLIVHVFYEPARQFYEFDELWGESKPLKLEGELEDQRRKLRTGIY